MFHIEIDCQESTNWKHQETVNKAIDNIMSNIKDINNPYAQAVAAYALQLADHPKKDDVLNDLLSKSIANSKSHSY